MKKDENIIEKSSEYAIKCHRETNHFYGKGSQKKPYEYHLGKVFNIALKFQKLLPKDVAENVIASCWTHDCIEDARQTYNNVKEATNEQVAELTYALTNEKGKNRAERGNDKYYEGIRNAPYATFVKLCDRIANVEYSIYEGSSMAKKYEKENEDFMKKLYDVKYVEMFDYLRKLFVKQTA